MSFNRDTRTVLRKIMLGNLQHPKGLDTIRVFGLEEKFFKNVQTDVLRFIKDHKSSNVKQRAHGTNWTKPFGTAAVQFNMLNRNPSNSKNVTKRFAHDKKKYPALAQFVNSCKNLSSFRINGMGAKSGLSPHEERVISRSGNNFVVRARFHLPIVTNPHVEMRLQDKIYHFDEGNVYYFNNGTAHAAENKGDTMRYHLVWDEMVNKAVFTHYFAKQRNPPKFLIAVDPEDQYLEPTRIDPIRTWIKSSAPPKKFTTRTNPSLL